MKQGTEFAGGFESVKYRVNIFSLGVLLFLAFSVLSTSALQAGDFLWTGRYRAEGVFLKNTTLNKDAGIEDSYLLNHLVLEPKIIAADGLNVKARFDIFNNALANNQAGQIMGNYSGPPGTAGSPQPPAVLSRTQQDESIVATELYLNWVQEFGALVVGRVPFHFGMGMVFNDGSGMFDHFLSTKDILGYKLAMGNITIMPAYGKVRESALTSEDDINDYIAVADYTNPETDLSMGFIFDSRVAPMDSASPARGNDINPSYFNNGTTFTGAAVYDGYTAYNMDFYIKKKTDTFNIGAELGFLNGYSGVKVTDTSGGLQRVELSGFGLATELGYRTGSLTLTLLAGLASGDDVDTARFEGFFFSPNYDVAMLLFNHPLGQYDVLRSTMAGSRATSGGVLSGLDTEVISNALYFAPKLKLALGEKYDLLGTVAYATTNKSPLSSSAGSVGTALGFETDLGFSYHPSDRFTVTTSLGFLFPGSAWTGSTAQNYKNDIAYGATTKAAINF